MTAFEIRPAHSNETERVATIIAEAFDGDPATEYLVQFASDPRQRRIGIFSHLIDSHFNTDGAVDVAVNDSGELVGAALWAAPNSWELKGLQAIRQAPHYAKILGRDFPATVLATLRTEAHHPRFPHWYLSAIGVLPSTQGHGVGSMLLERGLERADGFPAYLEAGTRDSARLYERQGFVELGRVPAIPDYEGLWGMWRPGTSTSS